MKQKKKMTSTGFLLLITIVLFFVMYAAGMVIFADKGFAKPQMFLNLFVSNAGLLVISCGLTIVMITGGIMMSGPKMYVATFLIVSRSKRLSSVVTL